MHTEAHDAVARLAAELGVADRTDISVLDLGGRNINGWLRHLFTASDWTTLDNVAAPEIDIVADARTWTPTRTWDLVLCTEVLEHVDDWQAVVRTAAKATHDALILTCASTGRPPHGQTGTFEVPADEHYGNVDPGDLRAELAAVFATCRVDYARAPGDAYASARH